ncbi:speckle-type POZ [Fusarium mexicanum]|uniref:Speckle-type POZ n=1 Tax=Fusarium mexicanum TaxID=751941 RepID=A0A8H5IAC2_9HYPO|nr:speckle-type POZ [Fusarium mexicanum]
MADTIKREELFVVGYRLFQTTSHHGQGEKREEGEIVSDDEKIAKHHSRSQTVYHIVSHLRVNAIADYGIGKLAKLSTRKIELILRKECHSSSHRRDVYRKQRF